MMSGKTKFIYFLVAVASMILLALASIAMASSKGGLAVLLFAVAFVVMAIAFVTKARIRRRAEAQSASRED